MVVTLSEVFVQPAENSVYVTLIGVPDDLDASDITIGLHTNPEVTGHDLTATEDGTLDDGELVDTTPDAQIVGAWPTTLTGTMARAYVHRFTGLDMNTVYGISVVDYGPGIPTIEELMTFRTKYDAPNADELKTHLISALMKGAAKTFRALRGKKTSMPELIDELGRLFSLQDDYADRTSIVHLIDAADPRVYASKAEIESFVMTWTYIDADGRVQINPAVISHFSLVEDDEPWADVAGLEGEW